MESPVVGSDHEFSRLTSFKPSNGLPKARQMIIERVEGQETVARNARKMFSVAEKADDQSTCDLLTQRMQIHEKNGCKLRNLAEIRFFPTEIGMRTTHYDRQRDL